MGAETPLFLVHLLGFVAFLWHGLYVLTRGSRDRVSRLTAATALVTAALFLAAGVQEALDHAAMSRRVAFDRAEWCLNVVPAALWLHLSLRLNPRAATVPWRKPVIYAAYAAAALISALGTFTELLYTHRTGGQLHRAGPAYLLYVVFVLACAGFAVLNLAQMEHAVAAAGSDSGGGREASAGELPCAESGQGNAPAVPGSAYSTEVRMLIAGAICFLSGVGFFAALNLVGWANDPALATPAWALLLAGLAAVGGTVGVQSTLLLGRDMRRDFLYSFTGLVVLLAPFLLITGALIGFDSARARFLALLLGGLIAAGHTLYDTERQLLDKVFFTPLVREERAAARAYVEALATQPAGVSPELATRKQFDNAVRRALTHLPDPTKLATTPLLNLQTVARGVAEGGQEDNRLNRAAVLKEILLELLDGLRPNDTAGGIAGDAYRFYNCLYFPYVRGIGRRRAPTVQRQLQERRRRDGTARSDVERVVDWLIQVDEDTFYKWQRRGSDTIAASLRERERAAGGAVPSELSEAAPAAESVAATPSATATAAIGS